MKFSNVILFVTLFSVFPGIIFSETYLHLGDYYYKKKLYRHSLFYYELAYLEDTHPAKEELESRLLLNYIRLKEEGKTPDKTVPELLKKNYQDFTANYIQMYAAFRFGYTSLALPKMHNILQSEIDEKQKDYAKLVFGSLYFEEYNLPAARLYYTSLLQSNNEEVRAISRKVLEEIGTFENNIEKSPLTASLLSAILPGSGYFYTKSYAEGLIALFWNSIFLGGGIYMYDLENKSGTPHAVSYLFLIPGIVIYISQIIGSYAHVYQYNNHQIRKFHGKLRELYFHTDFIEKTSLIEFKTHF